MSRTDHLSELESLRSQVAELSRTLAEQDQSMQNLHEQSDLLRAIVEGTASATGGEFFRSLVHHLARALNVRYVFVGEWHEERPERVRTLAVWLGTAFGESFEYDLKNAPCSNVLGQQLCFYPRDVQQCFPEDRLLAEMGVASYCGAPLFDRSANPLGLLVVMDDRPMTNPRIVEDLLKIFASRAAAELERARAEQERNQALADVYNVIEAIPDIVFALNTQGNLMKWNRRLVDVTGYSPEELLNKPALAFVPPEEQTHTATAIQRAFTEGYAELEGHLLTKDHRLIPYHWTGALLKNSQGEPIGITGVGRDVSDKRRAEEALRMSEERLALAVEGSSDILWDAHRLPGEPWYAPQTPIWWSPRVRELLGLEESESFETLEQWAAMLHPDDKDRVFGQLAAHIEHRVPYDAEYRLRTNRGDYLWIRGRGQASWDEQGEIRRMSGSCQDFTERKRMEEERQKQEVLISLMLNTGPACIKRVAADGSLLHMNPTGLNLVEACEGLEVVGRSVFDLVISEHRVAFIDMHRSVIEGHERTLQFEIQGLKGTRRWMESYAAPFQNPVTGQTEQLAVTHDITGRKQVEEALRESEAFNISVLNSLSAQIVVLDSQGVIIAVNKPWLRFAEENGAPHLVENFVGMNYLNVCAQATLFAHGEEAASAQAGILAVLAGTQNEFSLEYPCHSPDQQRWFRMRVTPLLDSQVGVVVAHENITERKQAEEALRKSEGHFRAIFENTAVGIAFGSHTKGTGISEANPAFQSMTGYRLEEICRLGMKGVSYSDDIPASKALIEQLVSGALVHGTIEKRYLKKDGSIMWAETTVSSIRDEQGGYENSVAMIQDITERKINEQLLAAEKRVLEMIVTDTPLQEILAMICRVVEELSPRAHCSILLLDRDGLHLRHGAAPSLPEAYVHAIDGVAIGPAVGSCGTAVFTRRQVIVSNIAEDPLWTDYRDLALDHGLQACWSTPVISSDGTVLGTFALYYVEPQQPTDADLRLVERVGHFACIAIERKQAEAALRDREEALARFKSTLEQTHDCVFIFAPDTLRFIYCNRGAVEQAGYSEAELFTMTPLDLKPEFTERNFREMLQPLQDGRMTSRVFETIHRHKDGHDVPVEVSLQLVREQGQEGRFVAIVRDVTERKRAEEALRVSEERFNLAVRGSNTGIWDWDLRTNKTYFSPLWKSMLGYGEHELKGEFFEWEERLHPDDRERSSATVRAYLEGATPQYELEHRLRHKDGSYRWILARGVSIRDREGKPYRMAGSHIDITDRKQTEEALRKSEERWQLAVRGSNDGIWDWTIQTDEVFFSPRWKEMLGFEDHEIANDVGEWQSRIHPDDLNRVLQAVDGYLAKQVPEFSEEYRLRRKDGSYMWVLDRGIAIWADDGMPLRMTGSETDITERKRAYSLLLAVINSTADGLLAVDRKGKVIIANNRFFELWRIPKTFLDRGDGAALQDFVLDQLQEPEAFLRRVQELYEHPEQESLDMLTFNDGRVLERYSRAQILEEEEEEGKKEIVGRVWSFRDVTERYRAEESLREINVALANAMPGISRVGPDGRYLAVNEAYTGALSYDPSELIGEEVSCTVHPDDRPRMEAAFETMVREGKGECEALAIRKDGSTFWKQILMVKILDKEGRHLGHHCFMRDITKRKQFEAMRARQYEALQAIFNMTVALSRASSLEEVYEQGIDGVQRALKVDRASILLFDHDGVMRFKASRGLSKGYVQAVEGHSPWSREAVDPPPICVADIEEDPSMEAYRGIFRAERIRALAFIPLLSSDGLLGKFMLYYDSPHQFTEEEIQVAQTIAGHIAFMIQRKRAETSLARRERELRTVLESLPVGVWFTDAQGKMLLSNPAAREIWTGVRQVSMPNAEESERWWEETGPLAEPHRWALTSALLKGEASMNDILEIDCLDGSRKVVRNSAVPVHGAEGALLGAILVNEDITLLRQAQEALRLTQFSVDHAVEGFFWIGPDARILNVNEAACRMLEYTREELTAMTVHDIDPAFPHEVWQAHWAELREKGSLTFESKQWSRTGRVLVTEVTINYLQYEGNEYSCAIMRDIGERKRVQAALRASEERYRSLYDETPTMYFTLATDGTVLSVNRFGAEQLGYQVEELTGHSVLGLFHEDDKETVAASLSECLAIPETTRHWEFRKVRKDGSVIWVRETVHVGQSSSGETIVLVTCEDITERKQAEDIVQHRLEFERLIASLSTHFVNVSSSDQDAGITQALCSIGKFINVDRSYVFLFRNNGKTVDNTHEWCAVGIEPQIDHLQDLPTDAFPWIMARHQRGEITHLPRVADLPPEANAEQEEFEREGIQSLVTVPIVSARGVIGFVGFDLVRNERAWDDDDIALLKIVGEMLAGVIERKRTEMSLRQSEERYRSLVDNAPIGIFVIEAGRFVYVNQGFQRILNATRAEQLLGMPVLDRIAPEFHQVMKDRIRQIIEKAQPVPSLDAQYVRLDESRVDVAVTAFPTSFDGRLVIQVVVLDITERKRVERELRKSHAFIRQIIDTDPNFIFAKDREGRFVLVNKAVADVYGTTVDDLIGKTDADFNPNQEEVEFFRQKDLAVMDTLHELFLPEEVITDSGGRIRWLQTVKRPILDDEGRPTMVLGASTDITERKRMEAVLRQRERDLCAAIEERERISQDLHDGILQSLFAVGLALETAKSMMSASVRKQSGQPLDQAIQQLNYVMREIRNFIAGLGSDLLQGKDLTIALKQMLASLTENQSTNVRLAVEDRAAKALSTEQSLHLIRVIQEAVSNCIQHGRASEARVSLKLLKQGVRLSVRDNGCGFNQAGAKRTGHGLRNMASRAKKIGGKFSVLSKVNEGTRIVFDVPRETADVSR